MTYDDAKATDAAGDAADRRFDDECKFCHHIFRQTEMNQVYCSEACADADHGDFESLDPDLWCLKHGKELPMGPYGIRYGGCDDCEPPEPDGEAFRGGEAAAYEREQMAHIQRTLK